MTRQFLEPNMFYLREEPLLEDMISDPIIRSLMNRDQVGETVLRRIIDQARVRLVLHEHPSKPLDKSSPLAPRCGGEITPACPSGSQHQAL